MNCRIEGCQRRRTFANGLCGTHNARLERLGTTDLPARKTMEQRFFENVQVCERTGCWVWTGAKTRGYGVLRVAGQRRNVYAHRYSYGLFVSPTPNDLLVCHDCPDGDNPACCNPAHLFLGTDQDNQSDSKAKGRNQRGEHHALAKLTAAQVESIRSEYTPREVTYRELAGRFGVDPTAIYKIVKNKRWEVAPC